MKLNNLVQQARGTRREEMKEHNNGVSFKSN